MRQYQQVGHCEPLIFQRLITVVLHIEIMEQMLKKSSHYTVLVSHFHYLKFNL